MINKVIVIVGPTGIGKTKLSISIAKHINGEIISGDSVQVYKGLNIGSAKVTEEEKEGVVHHLIDILEPNDSFSVTDYQKLVREKIAEIKKKNKTPIIVGGTGLYIKAVLYDYNFSYSGRDESFEMKYNKLSNEELFEKLLNLDKEAAKKTHPNNRKRVLRALEVYESNDTLLSEENNGDKLLYDSVIIGLTTDRKILYDLINKRVDVMMNQGLLEEVKALYDKKIYAQSVKAIGYKELYEYFDGLETLDNAIEKIKRNSRRFSKRQFTWFKNKMEVNWIDVDFYNFNNTIQKALTIIDKL